MPIISAERIITSKEWLLLILWAFLIKFSFQCRLDYMVNHSEPFGYCYALVQGTIDRFFHDLTHNKHYSLRN